MVSTNKTDLSHSKSSTNTRVSSKTITLLTAGVMLSSLVGCVANKPKPADPVIAPQVQQEAKASAQEVKDESKVSEAKKTEVSKAEAEQNADKLMASLKAAVVEPKSSEAEPEKPQEAVEESSVSEQAQAVEQKAENVKEKVEKIAEDTKKVVEEKAKVIASEVTQKIEQAKQTVSAVAKKAEPPKKSKGPAKPLSISLKDLPATYDIWVIKQGETPLTQGIVISTPTWEMGKEGYMSQIWLTLKDNALHVNSSSDIATEVKGMGVSIDGGDLIPFTRIAENNIGIVEGDWLDQLANAENLDIYLGFFPGKKPTSQLFKSSTSLENLDRVVATHKKLK